MPVIIHELVIKAGVDIGAKAKPAAAGAPLGGPSDRKDLIEACVEAVLKILESKKER